MNVDPFFSRLNPLVRGVLRSRLHWLASGGLVLLTITGRRSGRRYSIPVGYQQADEAELIIMVSQAHTKQWWRNYEEPGAVGVRLRGQVREGRAHIVAPDSAEFREHTEAMFRRLPLIGAQFGIRYDKQTGLTEAQREHLRETCAVVRVSLDP